MLLYLIFQSPCWWKALIHVLLYSSFISKHTHSLQQMRPILIPPPFLYPPHYPSVCVHVSWTYSSCYRSLIYHLCIVLIFSHSLPWPSFTSSHPSPDHNLFPWGCFFHHCFCCLHHSLLFSLSIIPPFSLSTHLSNKITHKHTVYRYSPQNRADTAILEAFFFMQLV